jgi:Domain of unknown function (DUF4440)
MRFSAEAPEGGMDLSGMQTRRRFLATLAMTGWMRAGLCVSVTAVNGCATGRGTATPSNIEQEARQFMASYTAELRAHDFEAVVARYHRQGVYRIGHGRKRFVTHDSIAQLYRARGSGPASLELNDVSYEVLSANAVVVIGTFRWMQTKDEGQIGSFTSLLVRQDGKLRIRLEDESFDNIRSFPCAPEAKFCELPLDRDTAARYVGEYDAGSERLRVFEQDGHLMLQRPGPPAIRLLYYGDHEFRLAANPSLRIRFDGARERATSMIIFRGVVQATGRRVE